LIIYGKPTTKFIIILSHVHSGISKYHDIYTNFWCFIFTIKKLNIINKFLPTNTNGSKKWNWNAMHHFSII